jgi:hypothetical protein
MTTRLSFAMGMVIFLASASSLDAQPRSLAQFGSPPRWDSEVVVASAAREPTVPLSIPMSPNTSMPRFEQPQGGDNIALMQLAIESSQYMDPRYLANSSRPNNLGYWDNLKAGSHHLCGQIVQDYKNFYLTENMLFLGAALAVAAPLANTDADQGIRDWYQRGAGRSKGANDTADVFKVFGHWQYVVPVYLGLAVGEHIFPDSPTATTLGQFGMRSLRAMAVGAPTVGVLQVGLGAGRPYTLDSHWQPFNHANSVAGHGFVGAVPFLTAAAMTDRPLLKALFFVGSFGTGWSRIQHDDHYFSQFVLGWAIAYLSVESVNLTELQSRNMQIVPCELPNGVGLGVQFNY